MENENLRTCLGPYRESLYVTENSRYFVRASGIEILRTCPVPDRESSYVPEDSRYFVRACGIEILRTCTLGTWGPPDPNQNEAEQVTNLQ